MEIWNKVYFFFPLFLILFFLPTIYFAFSFGNGSEIKITHGKLGYVSLGKPNSNNFIVYPDSGPAIGGYSTMPCGNFLQHTVLQHQGDAVTVWYQNNVIYQLTFESSNQLIIPECNLENNFEINKHLPLKFGLFCLLIVLLSIWHIYKIDMITSSEGFSRHLDSKKILNIGIIYLVLCTIIFVYISTNFTTIIELIFGNFK